MPGTRIIPDNHSAACCCDDFFELRIPDDVYGPVWCAISKLFMTFDLFGSSIDSSLSVSTTRGLGKLNGIESCTALNTTCNAYSGRWTSTIKDSLTLPSGKQSGSGIEWDDTDTPWAGFTSVSSNWGMVLFSGQFSSTIKSSLSFAPAADIITGVTADSGDTPWIRAQGSAVPTNRAKFYLQSGRFTSTIKTSLAITTAQTPGGSTGGDISDDSPNTLWCTTTGTAPFLLRMSGQFTSTIKNSRNVSTQGAAHGISL